MTYDAEERLIQWTDTNRSVSVSFTYDGDGRRVSKTLNGVTTTFVYDPQGQLAQDYGGPTIPLSETGLTPQIKEWTVKGYQVGSKRNI